MVRDLAKPTTFTGLVLDNTSNPIEGATCILRVANQSFTTTSDVQGRFRFDNVPAGAAHLDVNGLTATALNGRAVPNMFPPLGYITTIIPNAENSLPTPVLLPCMNVNNTKTYDGATDLVLTCKGIAGLKMTIKAGSMRKPDGFLVTPQNTAVVSLNQVHHDQNPHADAPRRQPAVRLDPATRRRHLKLSKRGCSRFVPSLPQTSMASVGRARFQTLLATITCGRLA